MKKITTQSIKSTVAGTMLDREVKELRGVVKDLQKSIGAIETAGRGLNGAEKESGKWFNFIGHMETAIKNFEEDHEAVEDAIFSLKKEYPINQAN